MLCIILCLGYHTSCPHTCSKYAQLAEQMCHKLSWNMAWKVQMDYRAVLCSKMCCKSCYTCTTIMSEKLFLSMVELAIQLSTEGSLNPEGIGYIQHIWITFRLICEWTLTFWTCWYSRQMHVMSHTVYKYLSVSSCNTKMLRWGARLQMCTLTWVNTTPILAKLLDHPRGLSFPHCHS